MSPAAMNVLAMSRKEVNMTVNRKSQKTYTLTRHTFVKKNPKTNPESKKSINLFTNKQRLTFWRGLRAFDRSFFFDIIGFGG